ncbi:MAG TPA: glycosyltransferase family 2 protein, partial [Candidatus Dormibacteraeota bacterium]|nr:glycosyltransferase family 2 protein [Candidatus Dormibacteraeota bacterium]
MSSILGSALAISGALPALFGLYLLTLAFASLLPGRARGPGTPASQLVVLVPAHDEEVLVARCVQTLLNQTYPRELYRVVVVADNCGDATAARAAEAGAGVMVRVVPESPGKGQALRWAMDRLLVEDPALQAVVVVDADTVVDRGMLSALATELEAGHDVVQADYELLADDRSPRSEMIAAAFLLFHRVRFTGRARLGMPANLVGNGMLFSRRVLAEHPWDAFTGVEDLEFSYRLRMAGVAPRFAPEARLWGAAPASRAGVSRQRLRWEGGRFHVVRSWLGPLLKTHVFDAAIDLATPPLALLV